MSEIRRDDFNDRVLLVANNFLGRRQYVLNEDGVPANLAPELYALDGHAEREAFMTRVLSAVERQEPK